MYLDVNLRSSNGSEQRNVEDASGGENFGDCYRKAPPVADRQETNEDDEKIDLSLSSGDEVDIRKLPVQVAKNDGDKFV